MKYGFDYAFRILLWFLPFYTVLSIFFSQKLGIPGISFLKEMLIISMISVICLAHVMRKKRIIWTYYDLTIGLYIVIMVGITVYTTWMRWALYGGRYDFSFLLAFFAVFHGFSFLMKPISYYIRIFLISGGIMIFISMLLKWPLSEDLLLYLGYSGNPSNWQFGSTVPVFHGVDGANVRRFQGLLDGPNSMGAYLLIYIGIFIYYFRTYKEWYFIMGGVVLGFFILILYTYSRSAALGFIWWVGIIILFLLRYIYKKYRTQMISLFFISLLLIAGIFVQYAGTMKTLLTRGWSTNGHMERMKVGIARFWEHPLGQWLWSAGPAYRYVQDLSGKSREQIEEIDRKYIPESWYIQQLVEWWIFGFLAFMSIMIVLAVGLFRRHIILFGMFVSICIMNLFLHTFESSVVALSLFLMIGLFLWYSSRPHETR